MAKPKAKSLAHLLTNRSFIEDMERIMEENQKEQERERKREEKRQRAHFVQKAKKAGFNLAQLKFLEENFAPIDHEHWNGRIG